MIIFDKKKAIATMMGRRQHKDGSTTEAPMKPEMAAKSEGGEIDGRHAAAEDVLMAIHEGSAQKMMEALANFHDLHRDASEKAQSTEPKVVSGPKSEE